MESYADLVRVGRMKTRAGMVIGWLCGAAIAATGAESDPDSTGTAERSGAGLLVIQETATPGARADGIRSFADAGYAVDTCEWTDRNHPGPVLGALARMRLQLADDAVLVVLVDLPAILSGGEHLDASVQWGPGRSAVSSTSDGRAGIELMDTLVAWAAPPRGRLVILAMQPPSRTTPEVIEASRRAFESPDHGPVRHLVWPAAPGAATERSSREVTILESSLSDADLPRRLKGPDFHTKFWEGIFRRVRALSGGRQEAILWSAPGADAGPTTDIERAGLAAVARSPDEVSAWSEAFRAARESGRYGAALGLSAVASRLAGADPVSQAQWAMERADVQIQMGQPASARRDLLTGASGIDMPGFPVLVKFRFLVLSGELEEAEGRQIEANAVWGEALSIHALLDAPPDELAARMFCGLARTASASGREAEARQRFDQAREAASRLPPSSHHVITRMFADRARWHAKIGEWADAGDASLKAMEPVSSGAWPDEYALETARVVAERMSVGGMLDPARNLMEHARRRMGEEAWRNAPEWARVQARIDLSAGRLEEAASALSRIPSEARARDAGWLELEAAILKSQGNLISAAEVYARAIRLLRGDAQSGARIAELEMAVAGCHLDMNQPHQALSACKSLLNRAELSDARRAEATRLAIRAALAADVVPDMQRYARMYLQMIREPEATPEEARWMLAASRKAQEAGDQDVAAKLARTAMIAGRNAEVKDHAFWADVREAHAQALPATRARAWMDALESLRLLGMSHQDISPSGIRVRLLLARIAREQGEPARAAFYHSEALAIAALPGLNTDPGVAGLVRAAMANPDHGNQMPAAVGNSADHQRYEAAAAMIR